MKVREAEKRDAEKISALGTTVWLDTYATDGINSGLASYVIEKFSPEATRQAMTKDLVLVIEELDHLLGYATVERNLSQKTELKTLYVLPKFQRQGVGKQLIKACQRHAKSGLWLTCWEHNVLAHRFYNRNGFTITGEDTIFIDGEHHRNIVFEST